MEGTPTMRAARKAAKVVLFAVAFTLGLVATQTPAQDAPRNPQTFEVRP